MAMLYEAIFATACRLTFHLMLPDLKGQLAENNNRQQQQQRDQVIEHMSVQDLRYFNYLY